MKSASKRRADRSSNLHGSEGAGELLTTSNAVVFPALTPQAPVRVFLKSSVDMLGWVQTPAGTCGCRRVTVLSDSGAGG